MLLKTLSTLVVGLSFLVSASAFAAPITVTFSDVGSHGEIGDPDNVVNLVDVGANATITSVAFELVLTAFDPSYLSEMVVAFESSDFADGVFFTPGFGDDGPGTASYTGYADLVALGLDFQVGADGLLRIEFFESWDDYWGYADGTWSGSFTFGVDTGSGPSPVPEPASVMLLAAGLAAMRHAGRRAASKSAAALIG